MSSRRKVKPGRLELSPNGSALEVHYESLDVAVLPSGQEVVQGSKQGVKRITLELPADGDLQHAAQQVVQSCKLLHPSRTSEVAQLLARAAQRQAGAQSRVESQQQQAVQPFQPPAHQRRQQQHQQPAAAALVAQQQPVSDADRQQLHAAQQQYLAQAAASATRVLAAAAATASLDRLDQYLEALYEEDAGAKAAAAAAVAQLCRDPGALPALLGHPSLLAALARLLREDARRSDDLAVCLLAAFFALSRLPEAHAALAQAQAGSLTMELLDLQLRRGEGWAASLAGAAGSADAGAGAGGSSPGSPAPAPAGLAGLGAKLLAGDALLPGEARLAGALARQEPALALALSLLLNMVDGGAGVEQKMVKKGLLRLLAALLARGSPQLLLLAVAFLRRLSLYAENCAALEELPVVPQLVALVAPEVPGGARDGGARAQLLLAALRLLHNLSFSEALRAQMVAAGLIARATALLQLDLAAGCPDGGGGGGGEAPPLRGLLLGLLYHLSLQDRHRSMFLYTDAVPTLHALLLASPAPLAASAPELAALLISLAGSTRVAEELSRCGRLEQLLCLAAGPAEPVTGLSAGGATAGGPSAADELLWRLLRTLAGHDSEPLRARFAPALERIARLLVGGALPAAAFTQALGCLAALDISGHDYAPLLRATGLPAFLARLAGQLQAGAPMLGASATDGRDCVASCVELQGEEGEAALLEVVQAVGVLCASAECAEALAGAGLVDLVHGLMVGRWEDDACVLATTAAAARLLAQPASRAALLAHPEVAARCAELLQHPEREVARAADAALEAVAAASEEWASSVRRLKFEAHNREWLSLVQAELVAEAAAAAAGDGAAHATATTAEAADGTQGQHIGAYWGTAAAAQPAVEAQAAR